MAAIVVEATASATDFALAETFAEFEDVRFDVERVAAQADRIIPLVWVTHDDIEAIHQALDADPTTASIEVLTDLDGERLYRMEWTDQVTALGYALTEEDGTVLSVTGENGQWLLRLLFPNREALSRTHAHCRDIDFDLSIKRLFNPAEGRRGRFGLTNKQQNALVEAYEQGYYQIPRTLSTQALADELGTSHQALSEQLRRAHKNLIENALIFGRDGEENQE